MTALDARAPVAGGPATPLQPDRRGNVLVKLRGGSIVVAFVLLVAGMSIAEPRFLSVDNAIAVLLSASIVGVLAAGQAIVVISGNVDLSVGSLVGLTAFVTGMLLRDGYSLPIAGAVALAIGVALGWLNGILIAWGNAPSIVVTLGTLNVYRGLLLVVAGGKEINAYDLPDSYLSVASNSILGVPILVLIALVVILVLAAFMRRTVAGRRIYAQGGNPDGAGLIGIRSTRLLIGVFLLSGLVAGVAGVLWGARYATVNSTAATGLELSVITAVVVGGVNIFGGSGSVIGAVAGALLLATIANSLTLLSVSPFWLDAIQGALILGAIGTDAAVRRSLLRLTLSGRRRA